MKKENLEVETVEAEKPASEVEVNKDSSDNLALENDSVKVMERYATAPSVSHLFVLIVSLLFIAAIITPNIAYIYNGGFGAANIIEANNFVLKFLENHNWNVLGINPTETFNAYLTGYIANHINPIFGVGAESELIPFITTCCLGAGLIASLVCAIYSFVCVVGGIGRKHAFRLSYVLLVFGFIAFLPALFIFGVSLYEHFTGVEGSTFMWPLIPGIGLILAIALVITCHVTYKKHIKNTISSKQAREMAIVKETIEEEKIEEPVIEEVKEDAPIDEASSELVQEEVTPIEETASPIVEETKEEPVIEESKEEVKPLQETVEEVKPSKPVTQTVKIPVITDLDLSKGLPDNITELGDHQFSKNLDIEIADIPEGIDKIGPACFANCLNLKIVNLPKSIEKISFNAFFACKKLTKINYAGTKVEWKKIVRGSNWLTSAGTKVVICSDGAISVNPFH